MSEHIYNVLFLCTGNSARSILAESILRKEGAGRFRAFSTGSHPKSAVNPLALRVLESFDHPTDGMHSKGWEAFSGPDAPVMDFVFTVCDQAAVDGPDVFREAAFVTAFRYLKNRISVFTSLPLGSIAKIALGSKLREIGHMDGSTFGRPEAG